MRKLLWSLFAGFAAYGSLTWWVRNNPPYRDGILDYLESVGVID